MFTEASSSSDGLLDRVTCAGMMTRDVTWIVIKEVISIGSDDETRRLFETLAQAADDGDVVGAIVIAMRPRSRSGKKYFMSLSGSAAANPTYASGAMSACQVLVQELALEDAGLG